MKKAGYLSLPARQVSGKWTEITAWHDEQENVLMLDIFTNGGHSARYLMDIATGEHWVYEYLLKTWHQYSAATAAGQNKWYASGYLIKSEVCFATPKDVETVYKALSVEKVRQWTKDKETAAWDELMYQEREFRQIRYWKNEQRKAMRYEKMVNQVPDLPEDFEAWAQEMTAPGHYALRSWEKGKAVCTACRKLIRRKDLKIDGRQAAQGETAPCPACGTPLTVKIRSRRVEREAMVSILQDVDAKTSVARFIDVKTKWTEEGKKLLQSDAVWIFLLRGDKRMSCRLLYNTSLKRDWSERASFWKTNPASRHVKAGYMYPKGIEEALKGTDYQNTARLIRAMTDGKMRLNYNRVLCAYNSPQTMRMLEYLYKGRFYRLLAESVESIRYWEGRYVYGPLYKPGESIEEVFRISDRQKINRIRDIDGGEFIVEWMQKSDMSGEKIPQETLAWLTENGIRISDLENFAGRMSTTKIMNYVRKQQAGGYRGRTAAAVLTQWRDYLDMCRKEKKNLADDMVFRPRELKRRHDEIVAEIQKRQMIEEMKRSKEKAAKEAARLREKFPGAEEILKEMKPRLEYQSGDYMIIVPERLVDITTEGAALHHCVGTSDRYFERIRNHETYICFLRKTAEPDVPYYTIEVEPGGTVRQHRGYLDEEPEIELVKPFIREWQAVLKKRLTAEDRKRARKSKALRQLNIEELKAKNNTRVLAGLMEDLMEAETA